MNFSGAWHITTSNQQSVSKGLLITAEGTSLVITNFTSSEHKEFTIGELINDLKYRHNVLHVLQKAVGGMDAEIMLVTPDAALLIDQVCEANRMFF